jgi:hypothetical protein
MLSLRSALQRRNFEIAREELSSKLHQNANRQLREANFAVVLMKKIIEMFFIKRDI